MNRFAPPWRRLLVVLLLAWLAAVPAARAHEARPAYLEIEETAPGHYIRGAELLGLEDGGRLTAGAAANLVVLDADPLEDPEYARHPQGRALRARDRMTLAGIGALSG